MIQHAQSVQMVRPAHASSALVGQFTGDVRDQVIQVYALSLRRTGQVGVVFAIILFLIVFLENLDTCRYQSMIPYSQLVPPLQ